MEACRAVLETCELLQNIIAQLPPRHILRTRGVSKTWNNLIKTTKRLRLAQILQPIKTEFAKEKYLEAVSTTPLYEKGSRIDAKVTRGAKLKYVNGHIESSFPQTFR